MVWMSFRISEPVLGRPGCFGWDNFHQYRLNRFCCQLVAFQDYYNGHRTHSALEGRTPIEGPKSQRADLKCYRWQTHCRGYTKRQSLHEQEFAMLRIKQTGAVLIMYRHRRNAMAEIRIHEGESIESALRRFKRKVMQEDILKEVRKHSFYLKPGEKKRIKQALARKRRRKKVRREPLDERK
jgi:small subunit ribosomal protein S21